MRDILSNAISAVITNIGLIASAEPDAEKRKILIRELAEDAILGIQEYKGPMSGLLYDGQRGELESTVLILKKAYINKDKL